MALPSVMFAKLVKYLAIPEVLIAHLFLCERSNNNKHWSKSNLTNHKSISFNYCTHIIGRKILGIRSLCWKPQKAQQMC